MLIQQLDIAGFRNLSRFSLDIDNDLVVLVGRNGVGKTSVLEAIHLLSSGHSFRTRRVTEVIHKDHDELAISAGFRDPDAGKEHRAGIRKTRDGLTELRLDYQPLTVMSELTRLLPAKALYPDSHQLIQQGPSERRKFVDWGLFHVEHDFLNTWKTFRRSLEQRNNALRKNLPVSEIKVWDHTLVESGEKIAGLRKDYVEELQTELSILIERFSLVGSIELIYRQGWSTDFHYSEALDNALENCIRHRVTSVGPQRAEIAIQVDGVAAKARLSRGQQKVLVYGLHLAQLQIHHRRAAHKAVLLCDDLPSELDDKNAEVLIDLIRSLELQLFVSSNQVPDFLGLRDAQIIPIADIT